MSEKHDHDSEYRELYGGDGLAKLGELVKDVHIAMMTTVAKDGTMSARPMAVQDVEGFKSTGTLWFLTRESSEKVNEVEHDRHVLLTFAEPKSSTYVAAKGHATVSSDRSKIKELWNPMYKAWFPKGEDDPEIAVMKVDVYEADYWEATSGKVVMMVKYAVAAMTGGKVEVGEAGHVVV